jgi:pimeloyl-ACP methyl ester carboxylesterase
MILLGHSIGGKIAMQLSITKPNIFSHVIVVDVAPVDMNLYKDKFPFIPFMTRLINDLIFLNYMINILKNGIKCFGPNVKI